VAIILTRIYCHAVQFKVITMVRYLYVAAALSVNFACGLKVHLLLELVK
jgi:hypothetical protein